MSKYDAARHGKVTFAEASYFATFASLHLKMHVRSRFLQVFYGI